MKILLIEDDEGFANGLRDIMQISDYHVEVALNGHTALDLIKENDYSAVIVDLNLPDFDGSCARVNFRNNRIRNKPGK